MADTNKNVNIIINAKDKTKVAFGGIAKSLIGMAAAFKALQLATDAFTASISAAADFEATIQSLEAVTKSTGRNINKVYAEMESHIGGLASKASVAEGFLKGLTTELTVTQISNLTQAVKDASIAMGEDFNVQLPMIIKAVKQLNPAILDNIGVTVRLDKVNKQIRDGYFGLNREINEATQQNAIYQEILKQTAKFQGQEAAFLETSKGKYKQLTSAVSDLAAKLGNNLLPAINTMLTPLVSFTRILATDTKSTISSVDLVTTLTANWEQSLRDLTSALDDGAISVDKFRTAVSKIGQPDRGGKDILTIIDELNVGLVMVSDNTRMMSGPILETFRTTGATIGAVNEAVDLFGTTLERIRNKGQLAAFAQESYNQTLKNANTQFALPNVEQFHEGFKELITSVETSGLPAFQQLNLMLEELGLDFETFKEELAIIQEELVDEWLDKWSLIQESTLEIFDTITQTLITNTSDMGENIKKTFEQIGQSIVSSLVRLGVTALFEWIAKTATGQQANEDLATSYATVTAAAGALAVASGVAALAQIAETVAVDTLADSYWSLAAAQAAASLGATASFSIAGATAVKAGQAALGFDNPLNDAAARRNGEDFGREFMNGLTNTLAAPSFGQTVSNVIQDSISPASSSAAGGGLTLIFQGPVTSIEFVKNELIPAIEQATLDGFGRLGIDEQNETGGSEIAFA